MKRAQTCCGGVADTAGEQVLFSQDNSSAQHAFSVGARFKWKPFVTRAHDHTHTLTILVLTSFSMALTSSAALGTSEDDCRDVSKDED